MIDAKRDVTYFLAKTEPSTYSIDQLGRGAKTIWDGVRKSSGSPGDQRDAPWRSGVHLSQRWSVCHRWAGESLEAPEPDPKDPKSMVVKLGYVSHLSPPTGLAEM